MALLSSDPSGTQVSFVTGAVAGTIRYVVPAGRTFHCQMVGDGTSSLSVDGTEFVTNNISRPSDFVYPSGTVFKDGTTAGTYVVGVVR